MLNRRSPCLKKLEQKNKSLRCIFVVADNARYYRNRQVKAFLETSKVKIIFLPPYSPNLNLIERLWRFLKKIVLYNRYYERFADFKAAILSFFANIKQYRPELESLMTLKFHTLEHIGVCCLLRRNLATPRLRSPSNSHSFFSKMNEAGFISLAITL